MDKKINTWHDVLLEEVHDVFDNYVLIRTCVDIPEEFKKKLEAGLRLTKLMDVGYGGLVTKKEWDDTSMTKFFIEIIHSKRFGKRMQIMDTNTFQRFPAFRSYEDAERFLSYPENEKLLEEYYA